jgi:hypothetical protein
MFESKKMATYFSGLGTSQGGKYLSLNYLTVYQPNFISAKNRSGGIGGDFVYSCGKHLKMREISGTRPVISGFFVSVTSSTDGVRATGNTARLTYLRFSSAPSTFMRENMMVRFLISIRSNQHGY